jgi:hypothetical protein
MDRFTADRRIEMTALVCPPFDPELQPALDAVPVFFTTLEPDSIAEFRAATTRPASLEEIISKQPVQVTDYTVTGHGGGRSLSRCRRDGHEGAADRGLSHPRWRHGRREPMGRRIHARRVGAGIRRRRGCQEYRLAPESDPVPVDCYATMARQPC